MEEERLAQADRLIVKAEGRLSRHLFILEKAAEMGAASALAERHVEEVERQLRDLYHGRNVILDAVHHARAF